MIEQLNDEEAARKRHRDRIERMRRSKRRQMLFRKFGPPATGVIVALLLALWVTGIFRGPSKNDGKGMVRHRDAQTADMGRSEEEVSVAAGSPETGEEEEADLKEKDTTKENQEAGGLMKSDTPEENQEAGGLKKGDTPEEKQEAGGLKKGDTPEEKQETGDLKKGDTAGKNKEIGEFSKADRPPFQSETGVFIRTKMQPQMDSAFGLLEEAGGHKIHKAQLTENTLNVEDKLASGDDFFSKYALLIDLDAESILAQKDYQERINPASMTKIMTVLVAAEHVEDVGDLDDTLTITLDITDYGFRHKCSSAGFDKDETVTVRDLFYGTVLPSGADAAVGLAVYVAGSQEAFVELMNEKLEEMGLSETSHFTNCVGVFDEDHYSTVYDIAMILAAAVDNELCREFLSAHIYTTSATEQHPEGIELSNWFLRRIEDKDSGGEVIYAKTGYVEQSGSCAASYARGKDGNGYVCVTVNANSPWRCIYDHSGLYKQFLG